MGVGLGNNNTIIAEITYDPDNSNLVSQSTQLGGAVSTGTYLGSAKVFVENSFGRQEAATPEEVRIIISDGIRAPRRDGISFQIDLDTFSGGPAAPDAIFDYKNDNVTFEGASGGANTGFDLNILRFSFSALSDPRGRLGDTDLPQDIGSLIAAMELRSATGGGWGFQTGNRNFGERTYNEPIISVEFFEPGDAVPLPAGAVLFAGALPFLRRFKK